jgi:hypothetical protein
MAKVKTNEKENSDWRRMPHTKASKAVAKRVRKRGALFIAAPL